MRTWAWNLQPFCFPACCHCQHEELIGPRVCSTLAWLRPQLGSAALCRWSRGVCQRRADARSLCVRRLLPSRTKPMRFSLDLR